MKKYILFLIISILSVSCSLDEKMEGLATRQTAYDTKDQAQAVVNKCYTYLNNFITTNFGLMVEACTDLWYCDTGTVDAYLNINPNNPGQGSTIWNNCYAGIMCCNEAIECILASEKLSDEDKYPLQAEARALRALYYYYLTNTFSGVPFYLCMVADRETQDKIQLLPRTDANEIRMTLYDDLRVNAVPYFTEENGLKARPSEIKGNRAGYALSLMLMAKFAMWVADKETFTETSSQKPDIEYWDKAIFALEQLETLYESLQDYPLEQTSWNTKNVQESIFELQHAWSTTGVQYSSSYGRLLLPPYTNGKFDGVSMPEIGENLANWASMRTTDYFVKIKDGKTATSVFSNPPLMTSPIDNKLHIDRQAIADGEVRGEAFDRRLEYVIGFGKLSTGATFKNVSEGKDAYAGPKFWCNDMVSSYDSNNYKLFRYADAILMLAECHARSMSPDLAAAVGYMNMTRKRAGLEPVSEADYSDADAFMTELRAERARELAGELHRKYDLVRWDMWYSAVTSYSDFSKLKNNIRECHEYYPIPDTECSLSNYVLTNFAYNE